MQLIWTVIMQVNHSLLQLLQHPLVYVHAIHLFHSNVVHLSILM